MVQSKPGSETCNNHLHGSCQLEKQRSYPGDFVPFPGFFVNNKDVEDSTPITKIPRGSVCASSAKSSEESSSTAATKTPPAEPSVSPEIQFGSVQSALVSGATPSTCYGAGHVISGVMDKRKCKARGILSVERSNPLEHDPSNDKIHCGRELFRRSGPLSIPLPAEASISWHFSPSRVDHNDDIVGEAVLLREEKTFDADSSPFSANSLGSGNVMQTPNSDSSSDCVRGVQLKLQFESVTEVPQKENADGHASWTSNSALENVSVSRMRVSWKDELVGSIFDPDCCRVLSDEEIDTGDHGNQLSTQDFGIEVQNKQFHGCELKSAECLDHKARDDGNVKRESAPCAESVCDDDGGLIASTDSDWAQYYKNQALGL